MPRIKLTSTLFCNGVHFGHINDIQSVQTGVVFTGSLLIVIIPYRTQNSWQLKLLKLTPIKSKIPNVLINWEQFKTCKFLFWMTPPILGTCNYSPMHYDWATEPAAHKVKKVLRWFAKLLTHGYREMTTPLQIFLLCNLNSRRVSTFLRFCARFAHIVLRVKRQKNII